MYRITLSDGEIIKASSCQEKCSFLVCKEGGREVSYPISSIKKIESDSNAGAIIAGLVVFALTGVIID